MRRNKELRTWLRVEDSVPCSEGRRVKMGPNELVLLGEKQSGPNLLCWLRESPSPRRIWVPRGEVWSASQGAEGLDRPSPSLPCSRAATENTAEESQTRDACPFPLPPDCSLLSSLTSLPVTATADSDVSASPSPLTCCGFLFPKHHSRHVTLHLGDVSVYPLPTGPDPCSSD